MFQEKCHDFNINYEIFPFLLWSFMQYAPLQQGYQRQLKINRKLNMDGDSSCKITKSLAYASDAFGLGLQLRARFRLNIRLALKSCSWSRLSEFSFNETSKASGKDVCLCRLQVSWKLHQLQRWLDDLSPFCHTLHIISFTFLFYFGSSFIRAKARTSPSEVSLSEFIIS